jgi:hypothetical protein
MVLIIKSEKTVFDAAIHECYLAFAFPAIEPGVEEFGRVGLFPDIYVREQTANIADMVTGLNADESFDILLIPDLSNTRPLLQTTISQAID